jgi:phosphoglycolate phosphatase-like HAD superfamily hydrolase
VTDAVQALREHHPEHDFCICIDSDGCAFDTMEIKHKECFIPNIIKHWDLQPVSKYARQAAEFVNLYSKWRGINRFPALTMVFDLLADWDRVRDRGVTLPDVPNLHRWIAEETALGNPALDAYCAKHDQADMHRALAWSRAVNDAVEDMVHGVGPFPGVRESLDRASTRADLLVCSATPHEALVREWEEHDIARYVFTIAGQEQGTKKQHIALATENRYAKSNVLMIGDAPGDRSAAQANGALFYPIVPGEEEESWRRFHEEALDCFLAGTYAGAYENELTAEFLKRLPDRPPWKT